MQKCMDPLYLLAPLRRLISNFYHCSLQGHFGSFWTCFVYVTSGKDYPEMAVLRARKNAGCEVCEVQWHQAGTNFPEIGQRYSCHLLECTFIRRHRFALPNNRTGIRGDPNCRNSRPLVITLRLSLYPDRTLGERIKKWRLDQGLFQKELAKIIGVDEMTVVNWEKIKTRPMAAKLKKLKRFIRILDWENSHPIEEGLLFIMLPASAFSLVFGGESDPDADGFRSLLSISATPWYCLFALLKKAFGKLKHFLMLIFVKLDFFLLIFSSLNILNKSFWIFKDEKIRRKKSNFTNINTRKFFNLPRLLEIHYQQNTTLVLMV